MPLRRLAAWLAALIGGPFRAGLLAAGAGSAPPVSGCSRRCPARRPAPAPVCRAGSAGWPGSCQCRRRQPWAGRHRIGFRREIGRAARGSPQARRRLEPALPDAGRSRRAGALFAPARAFGIAPERSRCHDRRCASCSPVATAEFRLDRHSRLGSVASGATAADAAPQSPRSACAYAEGGRAAPGLARLFFDART